MHISFLTVKHYNCVLNQKVKMYPKKGQKVILKMNIF